MLGFFVTPFPNETFYSLVGRFIRRFSPIGFGIRCLFGRNFVSIKNELATDLSFFIKACSTVFPKTASHIYDHHTVWPLYKNLVGGKAKERIECQITAGGKRVRSELASCRQFSSFIPLYCPKCNQKQLENSDELYWNRIHQIPNILVCPDHFCYLEKAEAINDGQHASEYIFIPNKESCPIISPRFCDNEFIIEVSKTLKHWLLTPNNYQLDYRSKMIALGYSKGSRLDFKKLETDFIKMVGKSSFEEYSACSERLAVLSKSLIYSYKTFINPVNHAIIQTFFKRKAVSTKIKIEFLPFGKGPWKCLNKTCSSFQKKVIKDYRCNYIKKTKKYTGYFKCSCEFEYTQSTMENSIAGKIRIVKYGSHWENAARTYLKKGYKVKEVARIIGHTVQSGEQALLKLLNGQVRKQSRKPRKPICQAKLIEMRKVWREAVKEKIRVCNLTVIRNNNIATYNYLIKNDGLWIKAFNNKYKSKIKIRVPRSMLDIESIVLEKIKVLRTKYPAVKITKQRLSVVLGFQLTKSDISQSRLNRLLSLVENQMLTRLAA
jgi:hypothetical protein